MQQENSSNKNTRSFNLEDLPDGTTTDVVTDLKTGIYNLFISYLNHLMIEYSPIEAVKISTDFLDQISKTFRETIENNQIIGE